MLEKINNDQSILVTGANGYIGRNLVDQLKSLGGHVIGLGSKDVDVTDISNLMSVVNDVRPSVVYHLAGITGVEESWVNPHEFYKVNVLGTQCVLDTCRTTGARMIFASAYLYDGETEDSVHENSPKNPMNPYAHTKYLGEQLCEFFYKHYGVAVVIVRPFNVYGGAQSNHFLIPSIIEQVVSDCEFITVKDLQPVRDYIYIEDVVSALAKLLEHRFGYEIFNIGTGKGHSVGEVVGVIQKVWGVQKDVRTLHQPRENEISVSIANIEKITRELNWHPSYSLKSGLVDMHQKAKQTSI